MTPAEATYEFVRANGGEAGTRHIAGAGVFSNRRNSERNTIRFLERMGIVTVMRGRVRAVWPDLAYYDAVAKSVEEGTAEEYLAHLFSIGGMGTVPAIRRCAARLGEFTSEELFEAVRNEGVDTDLRTLRATMYRMDEIRRIGMRDSPRGNRIGVFRMEAVE